MPKLLSKRSASVLANGNGESSHAAKRAKGNPPTCDRRQFSGKELSALVRTGGEACAVQVNQRALIDKMLGRYADGNAVVRELAQNADDAGATLLRIHLTTSVDVGGTAGKVRCADVSVANDGRTFCDQDWERVAKIAEGNPDENTVGMFGVGFYSVFSMCESPCIRSGGRCLAFHWDGDQLAYARADDPFEMSAGVTTEFVLPVRGVVEFDVSELAQYLESGLFFSKSLREVSVAVDGRVVATVERAPKSARVRSLPAVGTGGDGSAGALHLESGKCSVREVETTVRTVASEWSAASTQRRAFSSVECPLKVRAEEKYAKQCRAVLKKNLPAATSVYVLVPQLASGRGEGGRVFVGMSTHQSTGCAFHLAAHLYPTIERENVDFSAHSPLALWNSELTRMAGRAARAYYDYASASAARASDGDFLELVRAFGFEDTRPSPVIGSLLRDAFLEHGSAPVVMSAVGRLPSDQCFVPAHEIETLLSHSQLAVVPAAHAQCPFFKALGRAGLVQQLSVDVLHEELSSSALSPELLLRCMKWAVAHRPLYKNGRNFSKLMRAISYVGACGSVTRMAGLSNFADPGMFRDAPLPPTCLPSWVARHITASALASVFGLKPLTISAWAAFALRDRSLEVLVPDVHAAAAALELLSRNGAHPKQEMTKLCGRLREYACVPARSGKKLQLCRPADVCVNADGSGQQSVWVLATGVDRGDTARADTDDDDGHLEEAKDGLVCEENDRDDRADVAQPECGHAPVRLRDRLLSAALLKRLGVRHAPPISDTLALERIGRDMRTVVAHFARGLADMTEEDAEKLRRIVPLEVVLADGSHETSVLADMHSAPLFSWSAPAQTLGLPTLAWPGLKKGSPECRLLRNIGVLDHPTLAAIAPLLRSQRASAARELIVYVLSNAKLFSAELADKNARHAVIPCADGEYRPACEAATRANPFVAHVEEWFMAEAEARGALSALPLSEHPTPEQLLGVLESEERMAPAVLADRLEYLNARVNEFRKSELKRFGACQFLPTRRGPLAAPSSCFTGPAVEHLSGILDVYASDHDAPAGNVREAEEEEGELAFLKACGLREWANGQDIAEGLIARGQTWFDEEETTVEQYLAVIEALAADAARVTNKQRSALLATPLLLSLSFADGADGQPQCELSLASECVLVDNETWLHVLRPRHAPTTGTMRLCALYESLGSQWLTQCVREECTAAGKRKETARTQHLEGLLQERAPLLVHDRGGKRLGFARKGAEDVVSALCVRECERLSRTLVLGKKRVTLDGRDGLSGCCIEMGKRTNTLLLLASESLCYFDVGGELAKLVCTKESFAGSHGPAIAQLLNSDLRVLSSRGWPVARFVRAHDNGADCALPMPVIQRRRGGRHDGNAPEDEGAGGEQREARAQEQRHKVPNFAQASGVGTDLARAAVRKCRKQTRTSVHNSIARDDPHMTEPEFELCGMGEEQRLREVATTANGIRVFAEDGRDEEIEATAEEFAWYLATLADMVPSMKKSSLAIFNDVDSSCVAFNLDGSLYFSVRYFYQCHKAKRADSTTVFSFWFVVMMHELAHNLESNHNENHERVLEQLCSTHFPKLAPVLALRYAPASGAVPAAEAKTRNRVKAPRQAITGRACRRSTRRAAADMVIDLSTD